MKKTLVAALLLLGSAQAASASLLGLNASGAYRDPFNNAATNPATFTVGAGVETSFTAVFTPTTIDFDATSLTLIFQGGQLIFGAPGFYGLDFTFTTPHGITGFSIGGTVPVNFVNNDVTITADTVSVNLENTTLVGGRPLVISFTFASPPTAVPAPASLPLLLAGLAGLALVRRRTA